MAWRGRYILLAFDCMLVVGIYFCTDIPSALQSKIETVASTNCTDEAAANGTCCTDCLGLGPGKYNMLYTVYSWTSSVMILPVGFVIDRMGNRISAIVFTGVATTGAFLFAISSLPGIRNTSLMFTFMMIGRLFIGAGTGSSRIVRDRVIACWFPDRLAMAYGIAVSTMGLGSVLTFLLSSNIADWIGLTSTLFVGAGVCSTCLIAALCLSYLDWYGTKYHSDTKISVKDTSVNKFTTIRQFPRSYWLISIMIATYYSFQLPFVANGSKFIREKYGYDATSASYINGVIYDVSVVVSPLAGILLDKIGNRGRVAFLGAVLTVPMGPILLFTDLPPLPVYIWIGVMFTFTIVALWSSIPYLVPHSAIGTANGLASCMLDLAVGSTTLVIGKIISSEGSSEDTMLKTWRSVFLLIFGFAAICAFCGVLVNTVCKGKGAKVNGKVGLQRTASQNVATAAHGPAPAEGPAQLQHEKPIQNVYSIFKDIVIEDQISPLFGKYSSMKSTKDNNEDSDLETKKQMYKNVDLDNNITNTDKRTYSNMKTDSDLAKKERNIHLDLESKYAIDINITMTDRKFIVDDNDEQKQKLLDQIHYLIIKILEDSTFQKTN